MMSDLPGDLLEEILCRVPTKSLKQLRSTCKQWNSLFNNERFTRKHLHKAAKQFMILMVKEFRVCSMTVNLHGNQPVEVTCDVTLIDPRSSFDQFEITQVSHCDGLLLFSHKDHNRMVVWNPCTGQTRWIQSKKHKDCYALGSYRDKKSDGNSYKILSYKGLGDKDQELAIYEINSDSWRILDVTCDCRPEYIRDCGMSLNGNTYWLASDEKEKQLGIFLFSFDYTTERFGSRLRLPYQCPCYESVSLSVVREEKLSVLLQREDTSSTEVWVTNKIGHETKVVSWSKILTFNFPPELYMWYDICFLLDEEKKVVVCCDKYMVGEKKSKILVHVVGEDSKVKQVELELVGECWPHLINYVPSLTQIQQVVARGPKRKRCVLW